MGKKALKAFSMNRRTFLHGTLVASAATALPNWKVRAFPLPSSVQGPANPIRLTTENSSIDFNGDDISRPHDILWDSEGYIAKKGGRPAVSEKLPLVVIGGGVAGLSAAYFLKDLKPLILEQAPQFGGNAKGEKVGSTAFAIGAAYLVKPDEGSAVEALLKELDLETSLREEKSDDMSVLFGKKVNKPFWEGATDPEAASEFRRVRDVLKNVLENQYPDIPYVEDSAISKELLYEWDSMSFKVWMDKNLGPVHPHIEEYLQLYSWSSFCGSLSEVSAAQMLNFITSEMDSILALPGGNAAITERLYTRLQEGLGQKNLRASCFVLEMTINQDGVLITYEDEKGQLRAIQAQACVFASPKFVAARVIKDLPADQLKAIDDMNYRAYIVANVILKNKLKSPTYELYDLKGKVPEDPRAMNPGERRFTDICFGSWAAEPNVDQSIITVYKALPYDGARQFLFSPFAHEKNKKQIENQLPEVLEALQLKQSDIAGIRMTRWGHALPLARTGGLSSGLAETASRSVQNRIFFANQDNWLNPSFEAAFGAAQIASEEIRKVFG